jgi:CheY-like chemotaxis protein
MMPRISGFDVLDILRSTPETAHTKVIMMTALSEQADKDRGKNLGVDEYLVKSQVTLEDVVTSAKKILGDKNTAKAKPADAKPTEQS